MAVAVPLSTSGRFIVDKNGRRVRLAGVNWYGASEDLGVPAGLDRVNRHALAQLIAAQGFNSVRLPFSLWMVENLHPVDGKYLTANPDLQGKNPLGVYDSCVSALTQQGLIVIPNCHILDRGWCCDNNDRNGLWFNDDFPPAKFTDAWQTIAKRYASNPLVAGMDIKNEPRPAKVHGKTLTPTWGDGGQADFAAMYTSVGNMIHQFNPNALIMCEGLDYAANLKDAAQHPVQLTKPNKVVYSMHDYASFKHPDGQDQAAYNNQLHTNGGYLLDTEPHPVPHKTAPVWISEFGHVASNLTPQTTGWWTHIMTWLKDQDVDWCWWALNPTHGQSTIPFADPSKAQRAKQGDNEPFGLLTQDWSAVGFPAVMTMLKAIMAPSKGPGIGATPHP
jgi:aryl-phospho-beta-D-glucosidase BglC (GH1 family)